MMPSTVDRVPIHTRERINQELRMEMEKRLLHFARHPEQIETRLGELDREWDIERAIQANASSIMLAGLTAAVLVDRRFLLLPFAVAGFLLQHAMEGWCPPVPVLRRMGYRTQFEIETERYALKILRGDFHDVLSARDEGAGETHDSWVARALRAVRR